MFLRSIFAALALLLAKAAVGAPVSMELNEGWTFRQGRLQNWYPATVPGTVHTDLLAAGKIEDPFFRLNERGLQWVDKEDWVYRTTFDSPEEIFSKPRINLVFKGLDTYAKVWLNDVEVLSADNMFREWTVDVKAVLKEKGNVLKIVFRSPIREDLAKLDSVPFRYPASNDQSQNGGVFDKQVSVFARKAGYHYGWDWGPRLVTSGVWRPIYLEGWSGAKIERVEYRQMDVTARQAKVTATFEILADADMPGATVRIVDHADAGIVYGTAKASLVKGENKVAVSFTMKNPRLWWTNGLGEAHLYRMKAEVANQGQSLDARVENIGIRSIKLLREKDKWGESFTFELNGVKVFMKGANWIPNDNFLPRVTHEVYDRTVGDAIAANMNMLRVWGGGVYEDDYFYELCDRNGILVWQDFMFACSLYAAGGELLESIRHEAIDNVRRLRNHACLALWCGNNENQVAWYAWGWKEQFDKMDPKAAQTVFKQFEDQYFVVLPEVVERYGAGAPYTPSSPFFDRYQGQTATAGDRHYWGVWHAKEPISNYNVTRSRFFSEYGFQSFPSFGAVKVYAPEPGDWDINSDVMMSHQRGGAHANGLIAAYLLNEYRTPKDFEEFLYMNHILQGDAIKTAIEAHRRDMPYCMGSLYWQINDCWPVASWSSRDYYGQWKALHYFARDAFRDVLVSPIEANDTLRVFAVSDRLKDFNGELKVSVMRFDGREVFSQAKKVRVAANCSHALFTSALDKVLDGESRSGVFVRAELSAGGKLYANNYFLCRQKEVDYPAPALARNVESTRDGFTVTVSSDLFARGVCLSLDGVDYFVENNYFDILPGGSVTVKVTTGLSRGDFEKQLKLRSLSDA